jgi:hypothetical protein
MSAVLRVFGRAGGLFGRLLGFDRVAKSKRQEDLAERSSFGRILYFARPALAFVVLLYFVLLISRFAIIHGDELSYPQRVIAEPTTVASPGQPLPDQPGVCRDSQTVAATAYILDVLVNQNTWVPMDPQFKIGWFGLVRFEPTPFFDNKASFQLGALEAVSRMSIELNDLLGRMRRTSAQDPNLTNARGAVQWNPRAWVFNPFESGVPLLSTSAAAAYRSAIRDYSEFNRRLATCEALFDSRADNLFLILDRLSNDIGGLSEQLAVRSKAERWDSRQKAFVPAEGNNRGFFDFRADNLFWRAHGMMWAYHGLLQGMRYDFADAISQGNLADIWDRMEGHIAESARMRPLIVSNGQDDSLFAPDHLSLLATNMLRAQQNMIEIREVINR